MGLQAFGAVNSDTALRGAQVLTAASYLGCAFFALAGYRSGRRLWRALPATGFLLLAAAKFIWLARRVGDIPVLAGAAYGARVLGLLLLLAAVMLPLVAFREGRRHAAA